MHYTETHRFRFQLFQIASLSIFLNFIFYACFSAVVLLFYFCMRMNFIHKISFLILFYIPFSSISQEHPIFPLLKATK